MGLLCILQSSFSLILLRKLYTNLELEIFSDYSLKDAEIAGNRLNYKESPR